MKYFIWIVTIVFSVPVLGKENAEVAEDVSLRLAISEVTSLANDYLLKEKSCIDAASILEWSDLHSYTLSDAQIKTVLAYHSVKSRFECTRQERSQLVAALLSLQHFASVHPEDQARGYALLIDDFTHDQHRLWQLTAEYQHQIPANIRTGLMTSKKLQQPFRLMDSVKALGLD